MPRYVNIVHADSFIRDFEITNDFGDGLFMQSLPNVSSTGLDGVHRINFMSVVGVTLGSEYDGIVLDGEESGLAGFTSGVHYFSFDHLQPFDVTFLSYLIRGSDITEDGIQNPEGEMSPADSGYWDLPGENNSTSGISTQVFKTGPPIAFTGIDNPEVLFTWDINDLVKVYDKDTPADRTDDIVTAILIINSPFRGLGALVAMRLPLNPLKGTYKEFTSDVYNKKTDNENC